MSLSTTFFKVLIEVALKCNVIEKSGAWFTIPGVADKVQGQNGVRKFLEEHDEVREQVDYLVNGQLTW